MLKKSDVKIYTHMTLSNRLEVHVGSPSSANKLVSQSSLRLIKIQHVLLDAGRELICGGEGFVCSETVLVRRRLCAPHKGKIADATTMADTSMLAITGSNVEPRQRPQVSSDRDRLRSIRSIEASSCSSCSSWAPCQSSIAASLLCGKGRQVLVLHMPPASLGG